jgi:adenosine 3'-phospho 5'-phosphosulfate transporter B2
MALMPMKSLLIAGCLQACFVTYGILKENLVTQDHISSQVLILSTRLVSVVCAAVAVLLTRGRISFGGASLFAFGAFGFSNEVSTWAGYEMLKYVSFPVQVMSKSCKLLPSMIMGKILNKSRYEWSQYAQAIGAMVCVAIMNLTDEKDHEKGGAKGTIGEDEMNKLMKSCIGVILLVIFFVSDSFTSQWQTALYRQYPQISQAEMMLGGNLVGVVITMVSVIKCWTAVSKSLNYALANPAVMGRILMLGLSGAMGQFCIYTAIKVLGPLAFNWMMTSRQLVSVLISLVMFGHGVSPVKLMCILTVFAIMSSRQLSRVAPLMTAECRACCARIGQHLDLA